LTPANRIATCQSLPFGILPSNPNDQSVSCGAVALDLSGASHCAGDGACLALTIANLVRVTAVGLGLASVLLGVVFLGWLLSHAVLLII
jgi:hypothetical protein